MELEHDHEVREIGQSGHGVGAETLAVELDDRFHTGPVVVDGVGAAAHHDTHGLQRDHAGQS